MIKEITNFVKDLPPEFRILGMKPKEGLHILLQVQENNEIAVVQTAFTRKKNLNEAESNFLKRCQTLTQLSWMIDTNKCIDIITRAIHSCNPYCLAIKRDNLIGGKNYEARKKQQKALVYESLDYYFNNSVKLIDSEDITENAEIFINAVNTAEKLHTILESIPEYNLLKDTDYVIFYLDATAESYANTYKNYLTDERLFSKGIPLAIEGEKFGMSSFFNGFPDKKPYLSHQTASFDIAGRISSAEARSLFEFKDILDRKILPNPLPIFIYKDELQKESIAVLKTAAEDGVKLSYQAIVEALYKKHKKDLHNYYLFNYSIIKGEIINDFEFISKFQYQLKDEQDNPWVIKDWFNINFSRKLQNIFDLQYYIMPIIFKNSLIVINDNKIVDYRYFGDLEPKRCKTHTNFLLIKTYRKAFYDYIYKSKRQAISKHTFGTILQTSILDDIRLDEIKNGYHTQRENIRKKLNIWFSLSERFDLQPQNTETMSSKLQGHRTFIKALAKGEVSIQTDDEYAFAAGQIIYYIFSKSKTADRSYKRLEPFLQQVHGEGLNTAIFRLFKSYTHENYSNNFKNPFAELMDYQVEADTLKNFMPILLAGFFSKNELFGDKETNDNDAEDTENND